jgi:hypothetical protein
MGEWEIAGSSACRGYEGAGCAFSFHQNVTVQVTSDSSFRMRREIEVSPPSADVSECPTLVGLTVPTGGCSAIFDEIWTLTRAADPIAECRDRVAVVLPETSSDFRGPVETATSAETTQNPCDAAFGITNTGIKANEDVCHPLMRASYTVLDGGGTQAGGEPFHCEPVIETTSPLRWSCTTDEGLSWSSRFPWSIEGLTATFDEGATSSVTFRYVTTTGPMSCTVDLIAL